MDKVLQAAKDIERKLGKMDAMTSKDAAKMSANDLIKQVRKGNAIKACIKKGVKACESAQPTEAQMTELLELSKHIVELEEKQMAFAVDSKPQFDKLHCSGLIKKSVEKSETASSPLDMAKYLAEKHFGALTPEVEEMKKREADAMKKTVIAFSNATGGEDKVDELEDKVDDSD